MSWRIIKIETSGKLSFQNNQLRYDNYVSQESLFFPTEDIAVLILESLQISLTSALISELSEKSVTIIFCNGKHRPVSVLSPIGKPFRQTETAFLQIGMTQSMCNRLWQRNIRQKILNQSFVLKSVSPETARLLKEISERRTIEENDVAESRAARIYWQNLFSESFVRHHEDATNAALDYGYAIIRNVLINRIAAHGLIPCLGIHHHSVLNNFNLADDLIEPYRPFIDRTVFLFPPQDDDILTKEMRERLISVLKAPCFIDGKKTIVLNAIDRTVCSFIKAIKEKNAEYFLFPEFIKDDE